MLASETIVNSEIRLGGGKFGIKGGGRHFFFKFWKRGLLSRTFWVGRTARPLYLCVSFFLSPVSCNVYIVEWFSAYIFVQKKGLGKSSDLPNMIRVWSKNFAEKKVLQSDADL